MSLTKTNLFRIIFFVFAFLCISGITETEKVQAFNLQKDVGRWPVTTIFYRFNNNVTMEARANVEMAMNEMNRLSSRTGLTYRPCINCNRRNSILFAQNTDHCMVDSVGYNGRRRVRMLRADIRRSGCPVSTMKHEVMHILGARHEERRSDRSRYIQVTGSHPDSGTRSTYNLGTFDYLSFMFGPTCSFEDKGRSSSSGNRCPGEDFALVPPGVRATHKLNAQTQRWERVFSTSGDLGENDIRALGAMFLRNGDTNPIANDDSYTVSERRVQIRQRDFRGNRRADKDFGLRYNDGDLDGDIDEIVVTVQPAVGRLSNLNNNGNFNFDFGPTARRDSFSYVLVDDNGNRSQPAVVTLETTAPSESQPPPPSPPSPPPRPSAGKKTLTVTISGSGRVTSLPGGIFCGSACSSSYDNNRRVRLMADAASGYRFNRWTGSCTGTILRAEIIMNTNKSCNADFVPISTPVPANQRTLTVTKSGGTGWITSQPPGISCGSDCSQIFDLNTSIHLTARSDSGYTFSGWSGSCSGIPITGGRIILDTNKTCVANFVRSTGPPANKRTLSITKTGSGTVKGIRTVPQHLSQAALQINCGSNCSATFPTLVGSIILQAIPASGYRFSRWSGDCSGTSTTSILPLRSNNSCTANFVRN